MADPNLSLNDLIDSLALQRGQAGVMGPKQSPQNRVAGDRPADPIEIMIFDVLNAEAKQARHAKYSLPGGTDETWMLGRRHGWPMQSLSRDADPMDEFIRIKSRVMKEEFQGLQNQREKVRTEQGR